MEKGRWYIDVGGFHLYLLVFPFVYQFYSRIEALVSSSLAKGFQHHFNIISKFVCCGCYMKKNAAFALISFAVLKWHECLSFELPFELTVEIPVQLHLELEVNLLLRNEIEREIEREKVQMKPPYTWIK